MEEQKKNAESRFQKRVRLYKTAFPLAIIIILIGGILAVFGNQDVSKVSKSNEFLISIISLGIASAMIVFNYLQGKPSNKSDVNDINEESSSLTLNYIIKEFQEKLEKIEKKIENISTSNIPLLPEDKNKLFEYIEQSFSKNINENIFKYLEEKYTERSKEIDKFQDYLIDFSNIKARMANEINKLDRRANTNLTIGSATTITAVLVLYITVTNDKVNFSDTISLLSHFIPRLTIVIFIEIFAFFFLKLYKNNIDNIKYYHNELTNIDLKLVSLKQAIKTDNKETIQNILTELSKTERNFILKKEETTIELEKIRQDGDKNKNFIDILRGVISLKK